MSRTYKSETLQALANGWYIEAEGRILPTLTGYRIGVVGAVLPSREAAEVLLSPGGEDLVATYPDARALPVDDPWTLMRRAAGEGLCGFQIISNGEWSHRFMFMVRVEEAGNELPTILTSIHRETGWSTSLSRTREVAIAHAEVLHWERFDILDSVSGKAGQTCPFRDWDDGDPLFEICSDSLVVLLANVHLLGPWNSPDGAFAFFTSADKAEHYLRHHLGDGRNRMLLAGPGAPESPAAAFASLAVRPVTDLRVRLQELAGVAPIAAWCVNPDGHREDSGYGRLVYGGEHPAALSPNSDDVDEPRMVAVSGIWSVAPGNRFQMLVPDAPWTGLDTIRWSGGQSLQLTPLDRSFVVAGTPESIAPADLTETELADALAAYLDGQSLDDGWNDLVIRSTDEAPLNDFHLVWWDTVTGERPGVPWRFESVFGLLRQLAAYERDHDRHHRAAGASSCGHIGFVGSQDAASEDVRSERFRVGILGLAARMLREGYRPAHAADIAALCNAVLTTMHVNYVGHAKDLLWCSDGQQREELLQDLEVEDDDWLAWEASADARVDPEGRAMVVGAIGEGAWDTLEPRVRHFLSTALLQLDRQRSAPQLDYAPISLEVVKALEVELGLVVADFKQHLRGVLPAHHAEDRHQADLAAYLSAEGTGRKPPTLGAVSHFLRPLPPDASDLLLAFQRHVGSMPNHGFLLDKKFNRDGLMRVTNKFRNGGVHDSSIPEATCRECVAVLVGTLGAPGYIARTAAWKR